MGLILRVAFYISLFFSFVEVRGIEISDSTSMGDTLRTDTLNSKNNVSDTLQTDTIQVSTQFSPEDSTGGVAQKTTSKDTVKYWKTGGCLTLNLSQISLSNWSAGGENSIAANAILNLSANYAKGNGAWDNVLDFGFGRLKRENTKAVKTDDRMELTTKYGRRIAHKWFYSALLNFKTQLFPGYNFPEKDSLKISDFLSPGIAFLSIGIDFKPSDNFTFLLSTLTGKTTIVKSDLLAGKEFFGVDSGKHFRHEFGGFMKLIKKGTFFKMINYQLKVDAFSNYMEKPGNIDWDGELTVWVRLSKCITANFKTNLLYDDDIVKPPQKGARLQLREYVGVGFSYRF